MAERYLRHNHSGGVYGYAEKLFKTGKFVEITEEEGRKALGLPAKKAAAKKTRTRKKKVEALPVEETPDGDTRPEFDEIFGDGSGS